MRYPEFLQKNETIGFVAPSFGCVIEPYHTAFKNALKKFEEKGYKTKLGPNVYASDGIGKSTTAKNCGEELNEMYCGEDIKILMSCGGGETMCEVVPYMDFAKMKEAKPKWYSGFSDNTNFVFLSATLMDTAAVYGPCAASFGMEPWHTCIEDAFSLLTGELSKVSNYDKWEKEGIKDEEHPLLPYHTTEETILRRFPTGDYQYEATEEETIEITGRLIGGCMDCLSHLVGTRFDEVKQFNEKYKEDGMIWFLEACEMNVMELRRSLWQKKEAGWFQYVKGFLFGRPLLCQDTEEFGCTQYQAISDILGEFHVPIFMDLDIGHLPPAMPLVCGGSAEIVSAGNHIEIAYTWK